VPTVDTATILGVGYQIIGDWILGDDRQISGDAQLSANPPPAGDLGLSDAYFTLKRNYSDSDANAVIQKHITTVLAASGQITAGLGGSLSQLLFKVSSGDYQALVLAGPVYYWDIRIITTSGGVTQTIARGTVVFLANVALVDKAGTPAAFPNSGVPQFRGFFPSNPQFISSLNTLFNQGDFGFNSIPTAFSPVGWRNIISGAPGTWAAFGSGVGALSLVFLQAATVALPSAATSNVVFASAAPDAKYKVSISPSWLTSYRVTNKTVNGFTVDFGVGSPAGGSFDWIVLE